MTRFDRPGASGGLTPDGAAQQLAGVPSKAALDARGGLAPIGTRIDVRRYAACDGVTNDAAGWAAAIAACAGLTRPVLWLAPGADSYVASGISVPANVSVHMEADLIYGGPVGQSALRIGDDNVSTRHVHFELRVVRPTVNWSGGNANPRVITDIGIELVNMQWCPIVVRRVNGFAVGVKMWAKNGKGFAYNDIRLHFINNNMYGLLLDRLNPGFTNENNIFGGAFQVFDAAQDASNRYGVWITGDSASSANNSNRFWGPAFELQSTQVAKANDCVPVVVEHGFFNLVHNARCESNESTGPISVFARTLNQASWNEFSLAWEYYPEGETVLQQQGAYQTNTLTIPRERYRRQPALVFSSGNLARKAVTYDGAGKINVAGVLHQRYAGAAVAYLDGSLNTATVGADELTLDAAFAVGINVDARQVKRFVIKRNVNPANPGRVTVQCYDASGALLTEADGGTTYCSGERDKTLPFSAAWGGYRLGNNRGGDVFFSVTSAVASVRVLCTGGGTSGQASDNLVIRDFSVLALDGGSAGCWTGLGDHGGANLATQAPTSGTYERGRVVWNDALGTGNVLGWVCQTAGSPGTWAPFGQIGDGLTSKRWGATSGGTYSGNLLLSPADAGPYLSASAGLTEKSRLNFDVNTGNVNLYYTSGSFNVYQATSNSGSSLTAGALAFEVNTAGYTRVWKALVTPTSSTQTLNAATQTLSANAAAIKVTTASALTLASAPTLSDGVDGQLLRILNVGANALTLQDQGTLASSNLRLTAATVTLAPRQSIELMYSSTIGDWVQVSPLVAVL